MPINSAIQSGLDGYNRASYGIERAAQNISSATARTEQQPETQPASEQEGVTQPVQSSAEISQELVNLRVEQRNAEANANTIRTADEVLGTILDVRV